MEWALIGLVLGWMLPIACQYLVHWRTGRVFRQFEKQDRPGTNLIPNCALCSKAFWNPKKHREFCEGRKVE